MQVEETILSAYEGNRTAITNIKSICSRMLNAEQEYTQKGLIPPPKDIAQKLGISLEDYFELKEFIKSGEYSELCNSIIQEDLQNGAEVLPSHIYPDHYL